MNFEAFQTILPLHTCTTGRPLLLLLPFSPYALRRRVSALQSGHQITKRRQDPPGPRLPQGTLSSQSRTTPPSVKNIDSSAQLYATNIALDRLDTRNNNGNLKHQKHKTATSPLSPNLTQLNADSFHSWTCKRVHTQYTRHLPNLDHRHNRSNSQTHKQSRPPFLPLRSGTIIRAAAPASPTHDTIPISHQLTPCKLAPAQQSGTVAISRDPSTKFIRVSFLQRHDFAQATRLKRMVYIYDAGLFMSRVLLESVDMNYFDFARPNTL